jgi:hypothetical protein
MTDRKNPQRCELDDVPAIRTEDGRVIARLRLAPITASAPPLDLEIILDPEYARQLGLSLSNIAAAAMLSVAPGPADFPKTVLPTHRPSWSR